MTSRHLKSALQSGRRVWRSCFPRERRPVELSVQLNARLGERSGGRQFNVQRSRQHTILQGCLSTWLLGWLRTLQDFFSEFVSALGTPFSVAPLSFRDLLDLRSLRPADEVLLLAIRGPNALRLWQEATGSAARWVTGDRPFRKMHLHALEKCIFVLLEHIFCFHACSTLFLLVVLLSS